MREAVRDVVERQRRVGLDVVNDGEMAKSDYVTYVVRRLTGFAGGGPMPIPSDLDDYPVFRQARYGATLQSTMPVCVDRIEYVGIADLSADLEDLRSAAAGTDAADIFMTAATPGLVAQFCANRYYASDDEYVHALADALRVEYQAILAAGFMLQLDCPDLALGFHCRHPGADSDPAATARRNIEALNYALRGLPSARMRMHVCWGNYDGPHDRDVPLAAILPDLLTAVPDGLLLAGANPRHQHEWTVFRDHALPSHKFLVPGLVDTTTNFVEHADLVCERIVRLANLIGRERIVAGTDCGFSPFAAAPTVDADIAWAKLRALTEGADRASRVLWGSARIAQ